MRKVFTTAIVRDILDPLLRDEYSYSHMVNLLNAQVNKSEDDICCNTFLKIAPTFGWFTRYNDRFKKIYLLPYIFGTNPKMKVNFCPSCGKSIMNIELDSKFFEDEDE